MVLKEQVFEEFKKRVNEKVRLLQSNLSDLLASAANETKSTAGDKHETALAMLQIEQANVGKQLQEAFLQQEVLNKIKIDAFSKQVILGSLLKTNENWFFLSTALGKIKIEEAVIIALSPQSPLGTKFMGKQVNDSVEMNLVKYQILEIL